MLKFFFLFILFYFLVLLQVSFFVNFPFVGQFPYLILALILLSALAEKPRDMASFFAAIFGGFFLDIFSEQFIGFRVVIFFLAVIFIKFILRKYVQFSPGF